MRGKGQGDEINGALRGPRPWGRDWGPMLRVWLGEGLGGSVKIGLWKLV